MRVFIWLTIVGMDLIEYMELIDCFPSRLFNIMVSVLRLVMFAFNGMHQNLATGHLKPFDTYVSDISIFVVRP